MLVGGGVRGAGVLILGIGDWWPWGWGIRGVFQGRGASAAGVFFYRISFVVLLGRRWRGGFPLSYFLCCIIRGALAGGFLLSYFLLLLCFTVFAVFVVSIGLLGDKVSTL